MCKARETIDMTLDLRSNNALERRRITSGRTVLAMDRVLAGAEMAPSQAAQQDR